MEICVRSRKFKRCESYQSTLIQMSFIFGNLQDIEKELSEVHTGDGN